MTTHDNPKLSRSKHGDKIDVATVGSKMESAASRTDMPAAKAFDIRPFFPASSHGAILVTTRSLTVQLGEIVRLGKLQNIRDSLAILASTSHRQDLENGRFILPEAELC